MPLQALVLFIIYIYTPPHPPSFDIFLNFRLHIQHLSFFLFFFLTENCGFEGDYKASFWLIPMLLL